MEFWDDVFEVVQVASARGVVVVEAAGNGAEDLDHEAYGGKLDRRRRDSGAIMVPAHARVVARGFWVAEARIAGYRFAPPGGSLAAIARGGRREAIGTIEACFFTVRARSAPVTEGYPGFGGIVESEPDDTSVVAELRDAK